MQYFDDLNALLKSEHKYDQEQHQQILQYHSIQERREQGLTWFPVVVSNSDLGRGDYLNITIQKTNFLEEGHKFRFGMPVSLFSNHDPLEDRISGIVSFVNRNSMTFSTRADELPDWVRRGKLGVDLLFDENSYKEMFAALKEASILAIDSFKGKIVRQLIGEDTISTEVNKIAQFEIPGLNSSQNQAAQHILENPLLSILHGPPGTGKTTTLLKGIEHLYKNTGKQILVVAPSNSAVDLLSERLHQMGISVLRIGNPIRVSEALQNLTLEAKMDKHIANKERRNFEKQAKVYTEMAHKYKRSFGKAEREQRKALFDEARKIRKEADRVYDYILADIIDKSQVIAATLIGANHPSIRDRRYHTVVIDEAAQALEPACWIPILKADHIVMAGDHCQLPPTVKSSTNSSKGLYVTLFEKLAHLYPQNVNLLAIQYRMNDKIMRYSSLKMYENKLEAAKMNANWTLLKDSEPVVFIDTAGSGFEEEIENKAISNKEEALFLINHLKSLVLDLKKGYTNDLKLPNIGIVAPYRQQSTVIKSMLLDVESDLQEMDIQAHTIDSFQGQEKDIIYISLTRSNQDQQIGFLADIRRMNVAMTRAKKKLIVIGDSSTIGTHSFYKDFIDYVSSIGAYHSIWEWEF